MSLIKTMLWIFARVEADTGVQWGTVSVIEAFHKIAGIMCYSDASNHRGPGSILRQTMHDL
jgi:hypothetical protein